ncbi:hypothetical protein GQ53DRAFT_743851 [Thozetella sp. PMI_491]|nr:hypothetical protein GQ53DRAFT_743851 [Thozetella sp. PMI_491]
MARQRRHFAAALALGALAWIASAQDTDNRILYPVANLTFHYLDTVKVSLETTYDHPWLYLYCWDASGNRQEIIYYSPSEVKGRSTVNAQLQSDTQYTGTTCWFNLAPQQPAPDSDIGVKSPEFNYVKEEAGNGTFGLSTTSVPGSAQPTSAASSTSANSTLSVSEGLSTGAKAGISIVAIVIGIGGAAAAVLFLVRRRRTAGESSPESESRSSIKPPPSSASSRARTLVEMPEGRAFHEMGSDPAATEMWVKETEAYKASEVQEVREVQQAHAKEVYELPAWR